MTWTKWDPKITSGPNFETAILKNSMK